MNLLIYGSIAIVLSVLVVWWLEGPLGGEPEDEPPRQSSEPIEPGIPWRDEKRF